MTVKLANSSPDDGFWLTRQYNRLSLKPRRTLMGNVFITPLIWLLSSSLKT